MIHFKGITFKNFLSVGDQPTHIQLDKTITTVVTGVNGAGKSTFIDALVYGLFGKPFRKVRLGQIINNVNEKGLEVEVSFSIGKKNYIVKRGMKPALFEIWVDGVMIEQPATTADYQHILENDIIKLNYKTFTQIIVLGSASFKPFMRLKLSDRREVIEDLLDISVFSGMNKILKSKIKDLKDDIVEANHKLDMSKERHSSKREYLKESTEDHKKRIDVVKYKTDSVVKNELLRVADKDGHVNHIDFIENSMLHCEGYGDKATSITTQLEAISRDIHEQRTRFDLLETNNSVVDGIKTKISDCKILIENNTTVIAGLETEDIAVKKVIDSYPDLTDEHDIIKVSIVTLKNNISANKTKLEFYQKNNDCSECGQVIHEDFKEETIDTLTSDIESETKLYKEKQDRLKDIIIYEDEKLQFTKDSNELGRKITELQFNNGKWQNSIDLMTEDIRTRDTEDPGAMGDLNHYIKTQEESHDKIQNEAEYVRKKNDEYTKLESDLLEAEKLLALDDQALDNYKRMISSLEEELKQLNDAPPCSVTQDDIDTLAEEVKNLDKTVSKKKHMLHYYGIVQRLLKDDGLKTKIIRKFLPIINATVNMYLDKFDFPINFEFDENFNETIQSKYRNDFSYYSFSEGEKSRIDLALLFTWRETALKKSRSAANIIIFDEIFDGSLDVDGIENFMNILGLDQEGYSSYIISHNPETKSSIFDRHLEFNKDGHFSKMKESQ